MNELEIRITDLENKIIELENKFNSHVHDTLESPCYSSQPIILEERGETLRTDTEPNMLRQAASGIKSDVANQTNDGESK